MKVALTYGTYIDEKQCKYEHSQKGLFVDLNLEILEEFKNDEKNYLFIHNICRENIDKIKNILSKYDKIKISLNLSFSRLEIIHKSIFEIENIYELNLSHNMLENIDDNICNLKNLVKLKLNNNKLKFCPNIIYKLVNLKVLTLSDNNISNFDGSLLTNLSYLDISNNCFTTLPILPICLKELYIDGNFLEKLSFSIIKLTKLKHLNMRKNCLPKIPLIVNYINLEYINGRKQSLSPLRHKKLICKLYFLLCKRFNSEILKSNIYKILINLIKF